jgi:hypothetical protein
MNRPHFVCRFNTPSSSIGCLWLARMRRTRLVVTSPARADAVGRPVHLAFGVAGLALARTASAAYSYLLGGGAIYLVLWIYGLAGSHGSDANFVPLNTADDWLHFVLGIAMIGLARLLGRRTPSTDHR